MTHPSRPRVIAPLLALPFALAWRRLNVSMMPRSVKPSSSRALFWPLTICASSRIQNGSLRSGPSPLIGTLSCWMHQASAAAAVRCETDRDPVPEIDAANRSSQRS